MLGLREKVKGKRQAHECLSSNSLPARVTQFLEAQRLCLYSENTEMKDNKCLWLRGGT